MWPPQAWNIYFYIYVYMGYIYIYIYIHIYLYINILYIYYMWIYEYFYTYINIWSSIQKIDAARAERDPSTARSQRAQEATAQLACGKPIGGGREGVQAGRGTNILLQNKHQKPEIILHMYFGLPGLSRPLWNQKMIFQQKMCYTNATCL